MTTITVGVPSAGHPKIDFINSLLGLATSGLVQNVMIVPRLPIHQARKRLAEAYQGTHLLFVDDDMVFTPEDVHRLIQADKDVVSGLYMRRGNPAHPICYDYSGEDFKLIDPPATLSQVSGSLAFTLIKKEVIDAVGTEFHFGNGKGEDINYLTEIKNKGFEIWLEPKARVGHIMEIAL